MGKPLGISFACRYFWVVSRQARLKMIAIEVADSQHFALWACWLTWKHKWYQVPTGMHSWTLPSGISSHCSRLHWRDLNLKFLIVVASNTKPQSISEWRVARRLSRKMSWQNIKYDYSLFYYKIFFYKVLDVLNMEKFNAEYFLMGSLVADL